MADKIFSHDSEDGSLDSEFLNVYQEVNTLSSSIPDTSTTPTISSGSGAPATTPGKVGDIYIDTTGKRKYIATGSSSSADWLKEPVFYSGTTTVTGGGGDITITLPWDWSGGKLDVYVSATAAKWATASSDNDYSKHSTSYDALTSAGYTTNTSQYQYSNGTSAEIGARLKTDNLSGLPKSATSTTFVLDDSGATRYVKYFVWA